MSIPVRHKAGRRRGQILVDYVVTVAVIAVMAAILFPVFAQAREAARKTSCRTNLHQIGMALHIYARDHDGKLPPDRYMTPLLGVYVPNTRLFACPSEVDGVQVGTTRATSSDSSIVTWRGGHPRFPPGTLFCSYQYRGGLTLESPGHTPVAGDWSFLHQQRAMTLNLAGEVRPVPREQWIAYALDPGSGKQGAAADRYTPFLPEPRGGKPPTRPGGVDPGTPRGMPGGGNGP